MSTGDAEGINGTPAIVRLVENEEPGTPPL
jgi:hypothetical protein